MTRFPGMAAVVMVVVGSLQAQDQAMTRMEVSLDLLKSAGTPTVQAAVIHTGVEAGAAGGGVGGAEACGFDIPGDGVANAGLRITGEDALDELTEPSTDKKSPALAAFFSLILPGMGELYAGGFSSGQYFLMAEGALWLTYGAFSVHGSSQQDDARTYAISRAGIDAAGKDDQFYIDIGNFLTTEEYNDKKLRDRQPDLLYSRAEGEGWTWESDAARAAYKDERLSSERTYNNQKFIVAAIVVNHIASAINAARSAIAHNSALDKALGDMSFGASVLGGVRQPHGLLLTVRRGI